MVQMYLLRPKGLRTAFAFAQVCTLVGRKTVGANECANASAVGFRQDERDLGRASQSSVVKSSPSSVSEAAVLTIVTIWLAGPPRRSAEAARPGRQPDEPNATTTRL